MKIVRDNILNEAKLKLALAAGLLIIQDNKILLVHPTNASWWNSYSIPKGHVNAGEDLIDAAIRETKEEIGININKLIIKNPTPDKFVDYTKGEKVYKRVYYFIAYPEEKIKKKHFKIQKKEIDWAGFLTKEEAKKRISPRFKELLKYLK